MLSNIVNDIYAERAQQGQGSGKVSRRLYELLRDRWLEQRVLTYDDPDPEEHFVEAREDDLWVKEEVDPRCWFRMSEVSRLCPRLVALARRQSIQEVFQIDELWRFSLGTAYHHAIQSALASIKDTPFLGWWQGYDALGRRHVRKGPQGQPCPKPEEAGWTYKEIFLQDPIHHRRGHKDGGIQWPEGPELQEFKSIDERLVDMINPAAGGLPFAEHVEQVQGYLDLVGWDRARITYFAKSSSPLDLIMFEHEIQRDEAMIQEIRQRFLRCAEAREHAVKMALPPKLAACGKKSDRRAQRCAGCQRCFKAL